MSVSVSELVQMVGQIVTPALALVPARAWALGRMEDRTIHVDVGLLVLVWVRAQGLGLVGQLGSVAGLMLGQAVGVRAVGQGLGPVQDQLVAPTRDHRRTLALVLA